MDEFSGLLIASQLVAVVFLVLANGFFVAAEFALVSVRRSRLLTPDCDTSGEDSLKL